MNKKEKKNKSVKEQIKEMTEEERKELYEAYKKCWVYDPSEEEVNSRYDEEFLKACEEIMK